MCWMALALAENWSKLSFTGGFNWIRFNTWIAGLNEPVVKIVIAMQWNWSIDEWVILLALADIFCYCQLWIAFLCLKN